jgi:hypothetical protein
LFLHVEAILLHLAIAQTSTFGPLHILQTPALLSHVLDLLHPPSIIVLPTSLLQPVLEQLIEHSSSEAKTKPVLVVVGDDEAIEGIKKLAVMAEENGLKVVGLRDLERVGDGVRAGDDEGEKTETEAVKEMDVECIIWSSRGKNEVCHLPFSPLTHGSHHLTLSFSPHRRPLKPLFLIEFSPRVSLPSFPCIQLTNDPRPPRRTSLRAVSL